MIDVLWLAEVKDKNLLKHSINNGFTTGVAKGNGRKGVKQKPKQNN